MDASEDAGQQLRDDPGGRRHRCRLTLALGLVLIAAGLAATLSHATVRRTGTNGLPARRVFATTTAHGTICQSGETIPDGTAALRLGLAASSYAVPRLALTVTRGDAVIATGTRARWDGPRTVFVALTHTIRGGAPAGICFTLHAGGPQLYGLKGPPFYPEEGATRDGQPLPGRLHIEYLATGRQSWWSLVPTLVRRIDRGHAWSGPTVALLAALLMLTPIALAGWQLSRTER